MLALAALLLATPARGPGRARGPDRPLRLRRRATVLTVAYINPPGGASYAVVLHDGELVPMKAGPTGSGVRYVSIGEPKLVWHTKGDAGFLAQDDADETMIAPECIAEE